MNKKLSILSAAVLMSLMAVIFISCGDDDNPKPEYKPKIGDFKYGGVIFYIDQTGEHGLVCAVTDQSTGAEWGCDGIFVDGADGIAIGTGAQNTIDIEASCATAGAAANLCANLSLNGYDDWFLPSLYELKEMYDNKTAINTTATANSGTGFTSDKYWSSTEKQEGLSYGCGYIDFSIGDNDTYTSIKSKLYYVRAIRAF